MNSLRTVLITLIAVLLSYVVGFAISYHLIWMVIGVKSFGPVLMATALLGTSFILLGYVEALKEINEN